MLGADVIDPEVAFQLKSDGVQGRQVRMHVEIAPGYYLYRDQFRLKNEQGQAILTRTWVPTQDSPGIRQTYSARITAPADLTVVMSADHLTPNGEPAGNGMKTWRFRMDNPIPPYLIAIGAIEEPVAPSSFSGCTMNATS